MLEIFCIFLVALTKKKCAPSEVFFHKISPNWPIKQVETTVTTQCSSVQSNAVFCGSVEYIMKYNVQSSIVQYSAVVEQRFTVQCSGRAVS